MKLNSRFPTTARRNAPLDIGKKSRSRMASAAWPNGSRLMEHGKVAYSTILRLLATYRPHGCKKERLQIRAAPQLDHPYSTNFNFRSIVAPSLCSSTRLKAQTDAFFERAVVHSRAEDGRNVDRPITTGHTCAARVLRQAIT